MSLHETILRRLKERFPAGIEGETEFRGDLTIRVRRTEIVAVCRWLRDDPECAFDMLIDLCGVDRYTPEERFEVVYNLYSLRTKAYLRLTVRADSEHPAVDSMTGVWGAASWHERETYDMYGIIFTGHPDLRRMYMPEEFEHFPLRKDFPLMGIPDSLPLPRT